MSMKLLYFQITKKYAYKGVQQMFVRRRKKKKHTKKGGKAIASKKPKHFYLLRLHGSDHKLVTKLHS